MKPAFVELQDIIVLGLEIFECQRGLVLVASVEVLDEFEVITLLAEVSKAEGRLICQHKAVKADAEELRRYVKKGCVDG